MKTKDNVFRLGLIGAGEFGLFCFEQFQKMRQVQPVAIADKREEAARKAAERFDVEAATPEALLTREDVDVVHIATPPSTHYDLAMQALKAGKHVLCEKPLAITLEDGREMIETAKARERIIAVNLIMPYNPLCQAVGQILEQRLLGEPLHGFFENYAMDYRLGPEHWFWDPKISGGIFIEHGVHFFDLFRSWLGEGEVVAAQQSTRPGYDAVEQVQCTVRYGQGTLANFYHGFHQAKAMDRQEFRILCERGDIRLFEWVPTHARIDCLVDERTADEIAGILPNGKATCRERLTGDERHPKARHKTLDVDGRYLIEGDSGMQKTELYHHVVRSLLADQLATAMDPGHQRRVTEINALRSLEMAVKATELAREARERIAD